MGGIKEASEALAWFRQEVKRAGFPDLDLQFTMHSGQFNLSGVDKEKTQRPEETFMKQLGFNSLSHYQFAHYVWPDAEYDDLLEKTKLEWARIDSLFTLPYYPHISIGWDNSPRIGKSPVVKNNTPEKFAEGLRMAKAYVDSHPGLAPLITINSWNEWTETSYLQPDNKYGYGYLEAVKKVFVDGE